MRAHATSPLLALALAGPLLLAAPRPALVSARLRLHRRSGEAPGQKARRKPNLGSKADLGSKSRSPSVSPSASRRLSKSRSPSSSPSSSRRLGVSYSPSASPSSSRRLAHGLTRPDLVVVMPTRRKSQLDEPGNHEEYSTGVTDVYSSQEIRDTLANLSPQSGSPRVFSGPGGRQGAAKMSLSAYAGSCALDAGPPAADGAPEPRQRQTSQRVSVQLFDAYRGQEVKRKSSAALRRRGG